MSRFKDLNDKIRGVVVVMITPFKEDYELMRMG